MMTVRFHHWVTSNTIMKFCNVTWTSPKWIDLFFGKRIPMSCKYHMTLSWNWKSLGTASAHQFLGIIMVWCSESGTLHKIGINIISVIEVDHNMWIVLSEMSWARIRKGRLNNYQIFCYLILNVNISIKYFIPKGLSCANRV